MSVNTNIRLSSRDGDGGEFWTEWDVDEQGEYPEETLLRIRVVNNRNGVDVDYKFVSETAGLNIDSTGGDPAYPRCPPGQTFTFPQGTGTSFNNGAGIVMDDLFDFNSSLS